MTVIKENHPLAGKLEEWRTIRPARLHRGRVVKFFTEDKPDRNGKSGYGFLKAESGGKLFFCIADAAGVEVSKGLPVPALLFVRKYHLDPPLEDPKVGDSLLYEIRSRPCGCKPQARPWVYERDYEVAEQELVAR